MTKPVVYRLGVVRGEVGLSLFSALADSNLSDSETRPWGLPRELGAGAVRLAVHPAPGTSSKAHKPHSHGAETGDCLLTPPYLKQPLSVFALLRTPIFSSTHACFAFVV